ncbi:MAG: integrase core domain-containing protein [Bacteroidetes bacterium]|nr:integrase core domain-containing protein [Bacteroidota bacterium]
MGCKYIKHINNAIWQARDYPFRSGQPVNSDEYVNLVKGLETVKISMDGKGRATDNVYIERFFRTIKYVKIYLERPENGVELQLVCKQFIHYYNERRDHSSIRDVPPNKSYRRAA